MHKESTIPITESKVVGIDCVYGWFENHAAPLSSDFYLLPNPTSSLYSDTLVLTTYSLTIGSFRDFHQLSCSL